MSTNRHAAGDKDNPLRLTADRRVLPLHCSNPASNHLMSAVYKTGKQISGNDHRKISQQFWMLLIFSQTLLITSGHKLLLTSI